MNNNVMFNSYPDSIGHNLKEMIDFLSQKDLNDAFKSYYILPTIFKTDIDRGFSISSYDLSENMGTIKDLENLKSKNIDLTFDFIINHLSVLSPQFQDIIKNGHNSKYCDFFINWNKFWKNHGEMTDEGYIKPNPTDFDYNNLRKKSLPLLMVRFPDNTEVPYWNTFYQKITYPIINENDILNFTNNDIKIAKILSKYINEQLSNNIKPSKIDFHEFNINTESLINFLESKRQYLGQMDLNHNSDDVWKWYEETIKQLANYGASIIRLDSFSRLHKAPARKNFVNEPETWDILLKLKTIAEKYNINVLPEIHSPYSSQYYKKICDLGCMTYDYFLPCLILDAINMSDTQYLYKWASEIINNNFTVINMLGCHDGIPIKDVRGLLPEERINTLIVTLKTRGGYPKIIHGIKDEIYQFDTTYYSALGCDDNKLEIARAIQLFMPGKPQIWYIDLLAEPNDEEILAKDKTTDTREINRHSYTLEKANILLKKPIVQNQIKLLKLRNTHPAFCKNAKISIEQPSSNSLKISWKNNSSEAILDVNLKEYKYNITHT